MKIKVTVRQIMEQHKILAARERRRHCLSRKERLEMDQATEAELTALTKHFEEHLDDELTIEYPDPQF